MPALTAKIVFSGIAIFVGIDKPNETAVVFPNAHHHDVYLAVDDQHIFEQINGPQPQKPKKIQDPVSGRDFFYIRLDGVALDMSGDKPSPLDIAPNTVAGSTTEPDSAADLASMHWVPHLRDVWPTIFGNVHDSHSDLLSNRPRPVIVRSRFPLTGGRVEVTHVDDGIWQFQPGVMMNAQLEQAIAQEVTQTVTLVGSELIFTTEDLQTGQGQSVYRIGLKSTSKRTNIQILLANVPLADLLPGPRLCVNPSMACHDPNDPDPCNCVDEHFHGYYGVYPNPPSLSKQPIPHRTGFLNPDFVVQAHRVGGGNCGPTQYP
ncbi:MAG TPA: hypothetical protein VGQ76_19290 [Thermoanaerobaculia bacterium]|jgi:hypothetical protein|nr:hypothetical protein [Thermoanaerobaculia bacterium]